MYSCDIWCVASCHPQVTTQVMFPSICTLFFFSRLAFQKESFVFASLFIHNGLLSTASTWAYIGWFPLSSVSIYISFIKWYIVWLTDVLSSFLFSGMSHDLPHRLRFQTKIMKKPILFCNGKFSLYMAHIGSQHDAYINCTRGSLGTPTERASFISGYNFAKHTWQSWK